MLIFTAGGILIVSVLITIVSCICWLKRRKINTRTINVTRASTVPFEEEIEISTHEHLSYENGEDGYAMFDSNADEMIHKKRSAFDDDDDDVDDEEEAQDSGDE